MPMLIFVMPAVLSFCSRGVVTSSGCSSIPIPSVMMKYCLRASMISGRRSAARAGVPPPK